jgi:hypothetical protein
LTRSRKKENNGIIRYGRVRHKEDRGKLNVDVSFDADKGSCVTWMIIWEDHDFFIAGENCTIPFVEDATTVEAMALRDGLMMVEAMGYSNLVINSDCVGIIDVMKNGGHTQGPAAAIYKDCLFLCREFNDVILEHCPRESDFAAHVLAREAVDNLQCRRMIHLSLWLM